MSPVTHQPPPASRQPPPATRHPLPVTRYPSPTTRHPPPAEKSYRFFLNIFEISFSSLLAETPATYILMYCNASSTAFTAVVASNSRNGYWDCKLSCIRAQIELSSTFVYDYEMSRSGQFCEEFAPCPGGTNDNDTNACEPISISQSKI